MANIQKKNTETERIDALFERIASIIEQSRAIVYNSVNVAEVKTRYEVGRYIFEDEQQGERAAYGKNILRNLSSRLIEKYGKDWSYDTLVRCRKFYQAYENAEIVATPLPQLEDPVLIEIVQSSIAQFGHTPLPLPKVLALTTFTNHIEIMNRCRTDEERVFYMLYAAHHRLKVEELRRCIVNQTYDSLMAKEYRRLLIPQETMTKSLEEYCAYLKDDINKTK